MNRGLKILTGLLLLTVLAIPLFAVEFNSEEENPVLVVGTGAEEDYVLLGSSCTFTGEGEDVIMFGQTLALDGNSTESVISVGQSVSVRGDIRNNLITGGQSVEISGNVGDDVYFCGQTLTIGTNSVVGGTLIAAGNEIKIYGDVMGDLYAGAGFVIIDGTIHGDVFAEVGRITITERGSVKGKIEYAAEHELSAAEEKRVRDGVTVKPPKFKDHDEFQGSKGGFAAVFKLLLLFGLIGSGLLLLLFPGFKTIYKETRGTKRFWQTLLWGLIPLLIYPVTTALLMIVFPLAIALILAALPLAGLTTILGLTLLGQFLFKAFKWKNNKRHLHFLFGCALLALVIFIPVLGDLAIFGLSALGWGVLLELLFNKKFGENNSTAIGDNE